MIIQRYTLDQVRHFALKHGRVKTMTNDMMSVDADEWSHATVYTLHDKRLSHHWLVFNEGSSLVKSYLVKPIHMTTKDSVLYQEEHRRGDFSRYMRMGLIGDRVKVMVTIDKT